jgi:putative ABC transport system permease protein
MLAARSAWNRRLTLGLTLAAIMLSVALLLGVERVRHDARETFSQSVSGTDLVVGARSGAVQLMLYAVFRIGEATNGIKWQSYRDVAAHPSVAWSIPLSLGDSHRGYPVLGTTTAYFEHFRYGDAKLLAFASGRPFTALFDAVLGADIARDLGYRQGDRIVLSHGTGEIGLAEHADKPFVVTGILERTGTPVDRTAHISLEAMEAIHLDWQGGVPIPGFTIPPEMVRKFDLAPKEITAALIGLHNRAAVFGVQRHINRYPGEPLQAVMPGVALDQLWQTLALAERAMQAVSALVVVVGLAGLVAVMLSGLNERRRELAVLRAVGARPADILALLTVEGLCITLLGALGGVMLLSILTGLLGPIAQAEFGVVIRARLLSASEWQVLAAVVCAGLAASLVPGIRAYRHSLADGLAPRL